MIEVCNCADPNTGSNFGGFGGDCDSGPGVTRHLVLATIEKQDGSSNGIDIDSDVLNPAFFDGKFKDPNFADRWLILRDVDGLENPAVDPNTQTTPSGAIKFLSKGVRQVTVPIYTRDPYKLAGKLESNACRGNLGFYEIDEASTLTGQLSGTDFNVRKILPQSFYANPIIATDTEASRVDLVFSIDRSSKDSLVDYVISDSMGGYVMADTQPLSDVTIDNMVATTTQIEFDLEQCTGGAYSRVPATGLDETHLEIYNVTDDVVETLTSLTETTNGHYVAVYSVAVTSSDVMEVRGIGQVYVQLSYDLKKLQGVTAITA